MFLCRTHCRTDAEYKRVISSLSECDKALMKSEVSELASLLFPDKEELEHEAAEATANAKTSAYATNLRTSGLVYERILDSIDQWKKRLIK